jgi:hypothetical protein
MSGSEHGGVDYSFVLRLSFSCWREFMQSGEMNSSTALDASRISDFTADNEKKVAEGLFTFTLSVAHLRSLGLLRTL